MTDITDAPTKTWRNYLKPVSILLLSAVLAGGAVYGIKLSLRTAPTTTANTVQAARAQVVAMSKITNDAALAFGATVKSCHANITCVNNAANVALSAQGEAAGMVTLDIYPDAVVGILQNMLDDYVALQKTYLKVAESTSMKDAYKQLLPWPGEVAYSKLHTKDVLDALK